MRQLLEPAELERFRAVVASRFGLQYEDGKLDSLADVLRRRLEATGAPSADAYLERIPGPLARAERQVLASELTINETFFFRNADNFRAVAGHVLPERLRAMSASRSLRILSAGCSSGEEPYSLAMTVRDAIPDLSRWDVKITAIDLSPTVLARAAPGRYSAWSLRATSEELQRRYFRPEGSDFVLAPEVRAMVDFKEANLVDEDPLLWPLERYDLIFCRNVIMYFTPEVMRAVVRRASQALAPGGFLFLGHAETLRGLSQGFHLCHTHDTFYYQKRPLAPSPERLPARTAFPMPQLAELEGSWVEAIQRASERIADLARPAAEKAAPAAQPDRTLALEAVRAERFTEALALLADDAEPDALLLRAALSINAGRRAEAEALSQRLLALDELNAGAHYVMALCREHAGDLPGAIERDRTAIYLDAGFAMPHLHLGLLAHRTGDLATARSEHSQAMLLLAREDASRLLLFGGGFSRESLLQLCRAELATAGGA